MKNTPSLVFFITTCLFGALYVGALANIDRRDQAILEVKGVLTPGQIRRLEDNFETRSDVLDPGQ